MLFGDDSDDPRPLLSRLLGWSDEPAVESAMRSLALALDRRATLMLGGEGDLVPIALALHLRMLGPDSPFVVCDPSRRTNARLPIYCESGASALEQAAYGSLCIRPPPILRKSASQLAEIRELSADNPALAERWAQSFSFDEYLSLFDRLLRDRPYVSSRNLPLLHVLFHVGLHVETVVALDLANVDLEARAFVNVKAVPDGELRTVPFNDLVCRHRGARSVRRALSGALPARLRRGALPVGTGHAHAGGSRARGHEVVAARLSAGVGMRRLSRLRWIWPLAATRWRSAARGPEGEVRRHELVETSGERIELRIHDEVQGADPEGASNGVDVHAARYRPPRFAVASFRKKRRIQRELWLIYHASPAGPCQALPAARLMLAVM